MNAVRATHAKGVLKLKGTATARLSQLLDVVEDDVEGLSNLIGKGRVAEVGARHAIVNPAGRLGLPFGNLGVDIGAHVREEGNDVVVRDCLDLVDLLLVKGGMLGDPGSLLLGDADPAQLGLCLTSGDLNLLPDGVLILKLPDATHGRAGVAFDHECSPVFSEPACYEICKKGPAWLYQTRP